MSSRVTPQQYGQAVLEHVQDGTYPELEEIVSAELPPSAFPEIAKFIEQAEGEVKTTIQRSSRAAASDVDGWISQAKQLRIDIEKSQDIARNIVQQAQHGEHLAEQVKDVQNKVDLLNGEIAFNTSLGEVLGRMQAMHRTLDLAQQATINGQIINAVGFLGQAEIDLENIPLSQSASIVGVLGAKILDLRDHLAKESTGCLKEFIQVDPATSSITIAGGSTRSLPTDMDSLIKAMMTLRILGSVTRQLCNDLEMHILRPRLEITAEQTICPLMIDGSKISAYGSSSNLSAVSLFSDLNLLMVYLRSHLPASILEPLAGLFMPALVSMLISTWLNSAIPEDIDSLKDFEDTLSRARSFGVQIDAYKWPGNGELQIWANNIPKTWLRKRQELSLDLVRNLISKGPGPIETVLHIETELVPQHDILTGNGGDDWDAGWSDEEPSSATHATVMSTGAKGIIVKEDEDDVSAWGLEAEKDESKLEHSGETEDAVDEDAEAWGWGDDNEDEEASKSSPITKKPSQRIKSNRVSDTARQTEREVTLKETYNITSLPKEILSIITDLLSDAASLETSENSNSPIAAAAPSLLTLPGLILAMYRASVSSTYSQHSNGPMFMYNDSLWLAEHLKGIANDHTVASGKRIPSKMAFNLRLDAHISANETFGKLAYKREMEAQRTVLADLLDGAQEFAHCTEHPFNQECDMAIASTIDRLRYLNQEWKGVLSHSVLLQSLGSLLSTITNKLIVDIEDMSDISEPESQQLAAYCNRITALEDLFLPSRDASSAGGTERQAHMPLTALYAPHWFKFRYLANILESSLIDIKYLWTEGELGLEFDTEELVDLILALFADSPHRRNAIAEIRGRRGVR